MNTVNEKLQEALMLCGAGGIGDDALGDAAINVQHAFGRVGVVRALVAGAIERGQEELAAETARREAEGEHFDPGM